MIQEKVKERVMVDNKKKRKKKKHAELNTKIQHGLGVERRF